MRLFSICILLALMLSGCTSNQNTNITEIENQMPEQVPEDFAFSVQFGITSRNIIDTYSNTIIKDLVIDGIAETKLTFTKEEKLLIYKEMKRINVFEKKDLISNNQCGATPYSEDFWKITIDGEERSYQWSDKHCEITNDAQDFLDFRKFIWDIVTESEE